MKESHIVSVSVKTSAPMLNRKDTCTYLIENAFMPVDLNTKHMRTSRFARKCKEEPPELPDALLKYTKVH